MARKTSKPDLTSAFTSSLSADLREAAAKMRSMSQPPKHDHPAPVPPADDDSPKPPLPATAGGVQPDNVSIKSHKEITGETASEVPFAGSPDTAFSFDHPETKHVPGPSTPSSGNAEEDAAEEAGQGSSAGTEPTASSDALSAAPAHEAEAAQEHVSEPTPTVTAPAVAESVFSEGTHQVSSQTVNDTSNTVSNKHELSASDITAIHDSQKQSDLFQSAAVNDSSCTTEDSHIQSPVITDTVSDSHISVTDDSTEPAGLGKNTSPLTSATSAEQREKQRTAEQTGTPAQTDATAAAQPQPHPTAEAEGQEEAASPEGYSPERFILKDMVSHGGGEGNSIRTIQEKTESSTGYTRIASLRDAGGTVSLIAETAAVPFISPRQLLTVDDSLETVAAPHNLLGKKTVPFKTPTETIAVSSNNSHELSSTQFVTLAAETAVWPEEPDNEEEQSDISGRSAPFSTLSVYSTPVREESRPAGSRAAERAGGTGSNPWMRHPDDARALLNPSLAAAALSDAHPGGARQALLDALEELRGDSSQVVVNLKRLAPAIGLSYGTVRNTVSRLVREGVICTTQVRNGDAHGVCIEFLDDNQILSATVISHHQQPAVSNHKSSMTVSAQSGQSAQGVTMTPEPGSIWDTDEELISLLWPYAADAGFCTAHLRQLHRAYQVQGWDAGQIARCLRYLDYELSLYPADPEKHVTVWLRTMQRQGFYPCPDGYKEPERPAQGRQPERF